MEDAYRIMDGKVVVHRRGGVYYARLHVGPNKYKHKSLKTGNKALAIKAAEKLSYELEFKAQHGIPIDARTFGAVTEEYIAFRQKQHEQGHTSAHSMRQIERVARFWIAYAGNRPITSVGNDQLREYVTWRREYYTTHPFKHHNAKKHPQDKTIQWDIMLGKAIIKWAHERGYRGLIPLPTFSFIPKKKRVRPAFEPMAYQQLYGALYRWVEDCKNPQHLATRELLLDYVIILAKSGIRVGEANNLKVRDVHRITDEMGRINYRLTVDGKTGPRDVIPVASAVHFIDRVLERKTNPHPDDLLFTMPSGRKITTLADQFDKVLDLGEIRYSSSGQKFSLYSLRHFYAVTALREGVGIYHIARNMGTSVEMIQQYYSKEATPETMATTLGGKLKPKHKMKESET
ncbi:tyrosine-type recombinase/integrase [Aestuariivirga sp.]|uniref:tyrosine-type recombinase/integrase n=1 Tax=Aestuariivirga sp. TaxID=2650926 RepID=UPI003BAD3481